MSSYRTLIISVVIFLFGVGVTAVIFTTEPEASRTGAVKETAMLVDVEQVENGNFRPVLNAMGTVQASQDIMLSPRVEGQVIEISEDFVPGSFVEKGQMLLKIDPSDYETEQRLRQAELEQAEADLMIEMGRQRSAQREYQIYGDTLSEVNKKLLLREPQLKTARAAVQSARTAFEQAKTNLERTVIRAPFDAQILSRTVNVGSQVSPGITLARLTGINTYWIEATIPVSKISQLQFSDQSDAEEASEVEIRNKSAWGENKFRIGYLKSLIGSLEGQTRLARVLIEVPDPLSLSSGDKPSLLIGSFVQTNIFARELQNVFRIRKDLLREDNTLWLMEEGRLKIQQVDVAFRDVEYAYITSGIDSDARLVTTNLSTVNEGVPLRLN